MGKTFEKLIENQILRPSNGFYPTMDMNARYGKRIERMNDFSTREVTHFATSRQFNDFSDTESYHEGKVTEDHESKITAKSLRFWLLKSSLQIQVPGKNFLLKDANMTIGNIIRCKFLSNREYTPQMARDEVEENEKNKSAQIEKCMIFQLFSFFEQK